MSIRGAGVPFPLKPELLLIGFEAKLQSDFLPFLAAAGWCVHGSCDGRSAVDLAREQQPWVILIRDSPPDHNGLRICRRLRADPGTRTIPILILSLLGAMIDRLDGFRAGADAYLTIPCDFGELFVQLKALLPFRGLGSSLPVSTPWEGTLMEGL